MYKSYIWISLSLLVSFPQHSLRSYLIVLCVFAHLLMLFDQILKLFMLLMFLSLLIGASKEQIHDQHLPGNEDRNEQNGVIFGLTLQLSNQFYEQSTIIDDLCKEGDFADNYNRKIAFDIAQKRVIEVGESDDHGIKDAASTIHVVTGRGCLLFGQGGLASEDIEQQKANESDQCPWNHESQLRMPEQQIDCILFAESSCNGDGGTCGKRTNSDCLQSIGGNVVPGMPAKVVAESAEQIEQDCEEDEDVMQSGHLLN